MEIRIIQSKKFDKSVGYKEIHGKFPYKAYLEIIGNRKYGKTIAVISDKPISPTGEGVDSIIIQLVDKIPRLSSTKTISTKPNILSQYELRFKTKEYSVLDVANEKMLVFECINKK